MACLGYIDNFGSIDSLTRSLHKIHFSSVNYSSRYFNCIYARGKVKSLCIFTKKIKIMHFCAIFKTNHQPGKQVEKVVFDFYFRHLRLNLAKSVFVLPERIQTWPGVTILNGRFHFKSCRKKESHHKNVWKICIYAGKFFTKTNLKTGLVSCF